MAWKLDSSCTAAPPAGAELAWAGPKAGGKCNALWVEPDAGSGVGAWAFDIVKGAGMWVGVATEDRLKPGWGLKGLLYGGPGNLSDGGALVTPQWGPEFGAGDRVTMRVEVAGGDASVAFAKNGEGLGVAYSIANWTGGVLHPAVSLEEGDSVRIERVPTPPLSSMTAGTEVKPGVAGDWETSDGDIKLSVAPGSASGRWRLSAKVGNTLGTEVIEGPDGAVTASGRVMATRMMPPPHLQGVEDRMSTLLAGLTAMRRCGDNLVLAAGAETETFAPQGPSRPATREHVNWLN